MDLPFEVVVYLFKYLSQGDRSDASETCRLWNEAANDNHFNNKRYVYFYKTNLEDDSAILKIFENSSTVFTNFVLKEVEITNKVADFWERYGSNIKSITFNNCDIQEKVFMHLLKQCCNLERLTVYACRELFMSGRLMEGDTDGLVSGSLRNLKCLSLAKNRYLSDALFTRFVSTAPSLQELDLSGCAVSFHSGLYKKFYPFGIDANGEVTASESILTFHYILQFLITRASYLKKLCFSDTLLDGSSLKQISELNNLKLHSLEVNCCDQLTNAGIISLTSFQTDLRELNLGFCSRVTDQSLIAICNNLINLEYLNIQRCRAVTDSGISELHLLKKLVSLNISQCELLTGVGIEKGICKDINHTLKDLIISFLNLDQWSIVLISERLPSLRSLDVSYIFSGVTDSSIQAIFKNLVWLRSLKLSHCNQVSDVGLTGMGEGKQNDNTDKDRPIMSTYSTPPVFQRISLRSRAEEEIVQDARRKKDVLNMCENFSTDVVTGYSLARLKGLRELDLSSCNRITDVSLKYAFNFLELVTLDLSECQQITHEGIRYLVKNCPSIENLNLIDCYNIKDECVVQVARGLRRLTNLQLRGCNQLTDMALESIRAGCVRLKVLDIQGCRNMSPELACSLANLRTLHTILMSKPGPYISDGLKNRLPAPPPLPSLGFLNRSNRFL